MKKWIMLSLMFVCTGSFALDEGYLEWGYQDRQIPGYYFKKCGECCHGGAYQPMYQAPRFGLYKRPIRPFVQDCNCRDIVADNNTGKHGMVRCYNHEGLSIEYYYR